MSFFSETFGCCPLPFLHPKKKKDPSKKYETNSDKESYQVNAIKEQNGGIPPEEDETKQTAFKEAFDKIASDDGEIDAYQLRDILNTTFSNEYKGSEFSTDTCRSMVATLDSNVSGQLGFDETKELWLALIKWRKTFDSLDKDGSGLLDEQEIDTLLNLLGVKVGPKTTKAIIARYSNKEGKISFVDFVSCMLKLSAMMETYKTKDGNGDAQFLLDEFIQMTMYS